MMFNMITTYKEYTELRNKAGTTDAALVRELKLGQNFFSKWKCGDVETPRVKNLKKVTDYLDELILLKKRKKK